MIDLHSHILPALDDGVRTVADAVELARTAAADGITAIAATPHVRRDYPTTADEMERAVDELRAAVRAAEVPVEVLRGGEIAIDFLDRLSRDDLHRFSLAGSGRYLLLELPYVGWPLNVHDVVFQIATAGLTTVLAHLERHPEVQRDGAILEPLVAAGALVQVTAASVDGRLGRASRDTALALIQRGHAHLIASDAHAPELRAVGMAAAADAVGDDVLARWLTHEVPAAVVRGDSLPERPERAERPRRWRIGLRRR